MLVLLKLYKKTILGDYYYLPEKNYGIAVSSGGFVDVVAYDEDVGILEKPNIPIRIGKKAFRDFLEAAHSKDKKTIDKIVAKLESQEPV